jgi:Tubulin binding cofactor C
VNQSTIYVYNPIQGAIHITDCHHCTLYILMTAHQLRVHETFDLKCYIRIGVSAGIILEECKRVMFYSIRSKTANPTAQCQPLDVKDFEWLRSGVPSPNYSISEVDENNMILHDDVIRRYVQNNNNDNKKVSNSIPIFNDRSTEFNGERVVITSFQRAIDLGNNNKECSHVNSQKQAENNIDRNVSEVRDNDGDDDDEL